MSSPNPIGGIVRETTVTRERPVYVADESPALSHVGVWASALMVFFTVLWVEDSDGYLTGLDWFWAILIGLIIGIGGEVWLWWLSQRGESNAFGDRRRRAVVAEND